MGMHKSGRNDTKNPGASCTLENYLVQKYPEDMKKKKLTFEEWYFKERPYAMALHQVEEAKVIWKAAQENCTNCAGDK